MTRVVKCVKPAQGLEVGKLYEVSCDNYDLIHIVGGDGYARQYFEYVRAVKIAEEWKEIENMYGGIPHFSVNGELHFPHDPNPDNWKISQLPPTEPVIPERRTRTFAKDRTPHGMKGVTGGRSSGKTYAAQQIGSHDLGRYNCQGKWVSHLPQDKELDQFLENKISDISKEWCVPKNLLLGRNVEGSEEDCKAYTDMVERMQQIGGSHYTKLKIQPFEFIRANNLDFFEGNVVKYLSRYQHKNGNEDLDKAIHYVREVAKNRPTHSYRLRYTRQLEEYCEANHLHGYVREALIELLWGSLDNCIEHIEELKK